MRRALVLSLLATSTLTLTAGVARAQETWSPRLLAPEPAPTAPEAPAWYGWQTLAVDGAVAASWIAAYRTGSSALGVLGTVGYFAATPLIHGLHGRSGLGLESELLRLGAPIVGSLAGMAIGGAFCGAPSADQRDDVFAVSSCAAAGGLVGLFGAMVAVSIFDAANATADPSAPEWRPRRDPPLAFAPTLAPTSSGATLGLVGRF